MTRVCLVLKCYITCRLHLAAFFLNDQPAANYRITICKTETITTLSYNISPQYPDHSYLVTEIRIAQIKQTS